MDRHELSSGQQLLVRTADGVDLALYRAAANGSRGVPVLLVHGTFSNRLFFLGGEERGLARYLADRGWDAWVAELRGHGRSSSPGRRRSWRFEDWILKDAPALIRGVLEATGREAVVWVGHSAGGIIGVAYAGLAEPLSGSVAGLVLAGSPGPHSPGMLRKLVAWAGALLAQLAGRFPARLIGIGPEDEPAGVMSQWLRWNVGGGWRGDAGTDYLANLARVASPVLALAGGGDRLIAPASACEDLINATGSRDRTFLTCGRAQGFSEDFSHNRLLISSAARREVWPIVAEWLAARFA